MALLTVLAPGTPVEVAGMNLPNATIEKVTLTSGTDPLLYALTWRERTTGPVRRAVFRGDQVTERIGLGTGTPLTTLGAALSAMRPRDANS